MANAQDAEARALLEQCLRESGISASDETMDQVMGLYRHFAASRERLARADLGGTEPATIFSPEVERTRGGHGPG